MNNNGIKIVFFLIYVYSFWCIDWDYNHNHSFISSSPVQLSMEMNPGLTPPTELPPGVSLLHARALGHNDTLHFLFCSSGAPALLLIYTDSTDSVLKVNWSRFVSQDRAGSVTVEPESSVQYQSALVFTRVSLSVFLRTPLTCCNGSTALPCTVIRKYELSKSV